ncbi:MAG TPA: hypothetical protein VIF57_20600 [Polyangia bacterium]|jgi:hypothetical protein
MTGGGKDMERLIEMGEAATPEEARLRDLVQSRSGVEISDGTTQQIYMAVLARREGRHRKRFAMLRPAVVFGVVLIAAGATAAAALGHRWQRWQRRGPAPATAARAPAEPRARVEAPRAEIAPAPVELPATAPETHRPHMPRTRPRSEDPSAVVDAVEALRKQHDPDRAAKLLAGYLAAHPNGALAEEALALSIEAATARHDPAASAFARRYLRDYPTGRFRLTAHAVLDRQ